MVSYYISKRAVALSSSCVEFVGESVEDVFGGDGAGASAVLGARADGAAGAAAASASLASCGLGLAKRILSSNWRESFVSSSSRAETFSPASLAA